MHATSPGLLAPFFALLSLCAAPAFAAQEELGAEELELVARMLRRGEGAEALETLDEVLAEQPADKGARSLRAEARWRRGDTAGALADLEEMLARGEAPPAAVRLRFELATELGRPDELEPRRADLEARLAPGEDPRDAWVLARHALEAGRRPAAEAWLRRGAESSREGDWEVLLARARCQRALGGLERAAETLVAADALARAGDGSEPDVLVELGQLYFEVYGETDSAVSRAHSPGLLAREALRVDREHGGARLLLFELVRWNWTRTQETPEELLTALFAARPDSLAGLVARTSAALDDGDLPTARTALARLEELAPGRRDVRAERAALAWVEHRRDEARAELAALTASDPKDSRPELVVGWHLLELYRFAEALPFLEQSVTRDPRDWMAWTQLGRARANTADLAGARAAFAKSVEVGGGRQNAWRDNSALVLRRMAETMVLEERGALRFLWRPDEGAVLARYFPDFYAEAREELAARYGHTPGTTQIEVFRSWEDFSVRSTGFQGYPALGVCFGPVVTAVSPLSELRGTFSWARTSFHEFTHVIHLGLSNNRCPRWITEGLATWEEGARNPAWWRNMRRELIDARANGELILLRRLNHAFRGPRVLFAYYQSGLLCQMLIERHGFPPMVRLLEAFDRGDDLDQAFQSVFGATPEAIDADFRGYVDGLLTGLAIEPRWSTAETFRRRFQLTRKPPGEAQARAAWADEWCKVAWGSHLQAKKLDSEEALRLAALAGELPPRGEFLRAELSLAAGEADEAMAAARAGFERGGEDYRARMLLATMLLRRSQGKEALEHLEAAERAFPGFPDAQFSAELALAQHHERAGHVERAMEARLRWLDWNAGDYTERVKVAAWLVEQGRAAEAEVLWHEANEVDPFRRGLHLAWGLTLRSLGRHAEALREFEVALAVPLELDGDVQRGAAEGLTLEEALTLVGATREEWEALEPEERRTRLETALKAKVGEGSNPAEARFREQEPLLHGHAALSLLELGRKEEARAAVERALARDPGCPPALEARAKL